MIDYEFAMPCPAAFDIANHFSEWAGFECDYTLLPTRAVRRVSIEQYLLSTELQSSRLGGTTRTGSSSAETLLEEVEGYRGMPGLYWGLHALIEVDISHVGFDWVAYAQQRLGKYWAWRGEVDGTRASEGREVPLRGRRWAKEP